MRFSTDNFDCELPPRPRAELIHRPRARGRWRLDLNGLIGLVVLAAVIAVGMYLGREKSTAPLSGIPAIPSRETLAVPPVAPAPVVVQPAPSSVVPTVQSEVRRAELVTRRAELVKLPPPRAKLVAIPLGSWTTLTMPDGSREYALFRGVVPSGSELPQAGAPGDLYIANDTGYAWVWVPSANNGAGGWIDP